MHLDDPAAALRRMARALRPGGWLLLEEVDGRSMTAIDSAHPLADGFNATTQKRLRKLHDRGIIDGYLGGLLPRLLADAGLGDVTHEGIAGDYLRRLGLVDILAGNMAADRRRLRGRGPALSGRRGCQQASPYGSEFPIS